MHECSLAEHCHFYNEAQDTPEARTLKEAYCMGEHFLCARKMLSYALGFENIPEDLMPDELRRVKELLIAP